MNINDFLVDALIVSDTIKGPLSYRPKSIKDTFEGIVTTYQGTCMLMEKFMKVNCLKILVCTLIYNVKTYCLNFSWILYQYVQ